MILAGGDPKNNRESYMIKDSEGTIMTTREYIDEHSDLFEYIGTIPICSEIVHVYQFLPAI